MNVRLSLSQRQALFLHLCPDTLSDASSFQHIIKLEMPRWIYFPGSASNMYEQRLAKNVDS